MPLDPAGDAERERELALLHAGKRDLDFAVPRVIRGRGERRVARVDRARAVQQHVDRVVLLRADILTQRGDRAHDVRRAAGAAEPRGPLGAGGFQQVRVEEPVAGKRDAGERAVVHGALERVHIFRIAVHQEHAVRPEEERHGSARLVVAAVRQFVVVAVGFAAAARAASAGQMILLPDDVVPYLRDGVHIALVAGERGHVRHAGVHVVGADGVPDGLVLLEDGLVRLAVGVAGAVLRLVFEEMRGELQPARIAGLTVELRKAHFDDLVAGGNAGILAAEVLVQEFGGLHGHVEQRAVAGRLVIRRGALVEMPQVVRFMAQIRVFQPALPVDPVMRRGIRVHGAEGIQITVRLLRRLHVLNDILHLLLQLGVRVRLERVGRALQKLINIRVVERERRERSVLERRFARGAAPHGLGGEVEILQSVGLDALLERKRDRDLAVDLLTFREQSRGEPDFRKRHGLDRIVRVRGKGRGGHERGASGEDHFCHDVTCHVL